MVSAKAHVLVPKWIEYLSGERIRENKDTWASSHIIELDEPFLINSGPSVRKFTKEVTISEEKNNLNLAITDNKWG